MAVLNFDEPPTIYGDGPLDAIAAGLIALGEELQATVVAKEEAEDKNLVQSNFIAKMSHELRSPLTAIATSAELLMSSRLTIHQDRLVTNLIESSAMLLRSIDNILEYANSQNEPISLKLASFDLETTIDEILRPHFTKAKSSGLGFSFDYSGTPDLIVCSDKHRLGQILFNIVSNAIKFTEEGSVSVQVSTNTSGTDEIVNIEVKDTGIGMAKRTIDAAAKPFYSLDSSLRRKLDGTGLGLTLVEAIVEAMGGTLNIQSDMGIGTTVRLQFTCPRDVSQSRVLQHSTTPKFSEVHILIVDDTPLVAEVTKSVIENIGMKADVLNSGESALKHPDLTIYSAILMDCHMPVMDGLAATKLLLSQPRYADLNIIAFSAQCSADFISECLNAGMVSHMRKPFTISGLKEVLVRYGG